MESPVDDEPTIVATQRSEPYPTSVPRIARWSRHDSNVACASESFGGRVLKLPWETGIAGRVIMGNPMFTLPLIGDSPMTIGRSDFLMGAAATVSSVLCAYGASLA